MPSDPWPGVEVTPSRPSGGGDAWPGEEVPASDYMTTGINALGGAQGLSATPWYRQGIFSQGIPGLLGPGHIDGPSTEDVIDTLPAAGGAAGGYLGFAAGVPTTAGTGSIPMAVGGAALGGAAGEAARQHLRRAIGAYSPTTTEEAATDVGTQGAIQAASELTGHGIGRVVGSAVTKTFAPFAGSLDQPVIDAAERVMLPPASAFAESQAERSARQALEHLPAAARSKSKYVPTVEAWAAKGIGGGKAAERYTVSNNSLTAIADHTVARASKLQDNSARGEVINKGFETFRTNWIKQKNALYAQASVPESGITVSPKETLALLDEIIANKESAGSVLKAGPTADASFYRGVRDGLTKKAETAGPPKEFADFRTPKASTPRVLRDIEARDLMNAHRELNAMLDASHTDPFSKANEGLLKKVAATLEGEMTAAIGQKRPDLAARLAVANKAYGEGLDKINSSFGESIHKFAEANQYDKIAGSIANSRMSVDDIPRIMEVAGAEGTEAMRAAVLADLVSKAKNPAGQLTPMKLGQVMKNFGEDRLSALLTPEQMARLKDVATLSASLQKGKKVMEGSQTAFLGRYGLAPSGIGALVNLPSTLLYLAGDAATNRFLASKVGQRWLTTGYQPFTRGGITRAVTTTAHAATVPFAPEDR